MKRQHSDKCSYQGIIITDNYGGYDSWVARIPPLNSTPPASIVGAETPTLAAVAPRWEPVV